MDQETAKYLWGLREVNKALVTGLETAVFVMARWEELEPERRESIIEKLQALIAQGKQACGAKPPEH